MSRRAGLALVSGLALLWGACASAPGQVPSQAQRLQARATYERGLAYIRDRQPALALGSLREAIALDGTVPEYHNSHGLLLLELGRPDLALEAFQKALALRPDYGEAELNSGIALAEMGQWREAVPRYRKALTLQNLASESAAHQNLGLALYHLRQYPEAERELRFAIALEPRMEAAYYNLGLLLVATGRRSEARAAFQQVRDMAPQTPFGRAAVEQLRGLGEGR